MIQGRSNHLQSHNIVNLRKIEDRAFVDRLVNFGHRNISIQQVKFNESTGISQYRILVNNFCLLIRVLHVLDCAEQINEPHLILGQGGNGLVHIKQGNRKYIAVKRLIFHSETNIHKYLKHISQMQRDSFWQDCFCNEFKSLLVELTLAKLCSAYEIGSAMINDFPFDAICYQDCFQFFQEVCQSAEMHSQEQFQKYAKDLEFNSQVLHQELMMAHCDIKPQNIMFSRNYQKYVLIDFGSCQVVDGDFCVMTTFKGTRGFWSEEMEKLYHDNKNSRRNKEKPKSRLVDLKNHDKVCIERTIREAKRDIKRDEAPPSHVEYERKSVSNEFSLFQIAKVLLNYKNHNDMAMISKQVDINKTLEYCIDNKKFLLLVKFIIGALERRGRKVDIAPKTWSIQSFFINYRKKQDSTLQTLDNLQMRYNAELRINGYTKYVMDMEDQLRQHNKFKSQIPEIPAKVRRMAMQIYDEQSTMITFDKNNRIKLKGTYVFSTIERDLIDIKEHERSLLFELSDLHSDGATASQLTRVYTRLFHLLFLKFNSNFCILKRMQILEEMKKLQFLGKSEKKMLNLYSIIYNFNYGQQHEEIRLQEAMKAFKKYSNDKYYYSLALEELSKIYETLGKIEKAEELLSECIQCFLEMYKDENHAIMEVRYQRLAELKLEQGCYEEALKLYDKIKAINERYCRTSSLCLSLLRSKLCFYEKTIDKLEECVEDARLRLQEHFSDEHPFFLRFEMAVIIRQKLPIFKKQIQIVNLIHRFLSGLGINSISNYIKFRKQVKANYGFIKNHQIFKIFIKGMYTISLQRFDYHSAQHYLLVLIEVEYGVTFQYYLYLLKLMIETAQQRKAICYLKKCSDIFKKQQYPPESQLIKYFEYLKFKYEMTFQMYEMSEQFRLNKLHDIISRKNEIYVNDLAIEAYIMLARMEVHNRPFQGTKSICQKSRNLLQEAMELEQRGRNRPQIFNYIEQQISQLYITCKKQFEFTEIHITNGIEHIKEVVDCKHDYFSRNMLLIQAKNLYYNESDIDKAYEIGKKCTRYFSAYEKVNIGLLQTCFLMSQIEQNRLNYKQAYNYAMKALRLTTDLMPQPSNLLYTCSQRLSSLLKTMKKECLCIYGMAAEPINIYAYFQDHVPYVKTYSARRLNISAEDDMEQGQELKQIKTFLSSFRKHVQKFKFLSTLLLIKMIEHEKRLLKIIIRQKMRWKELMKLKGSQSKKHRTVSHEREALFRIYIKLKILNEKERAQEYYNRIFVDMSVEMSERFFKIFEDFEEDMDL